MGNLETVLFSKCTRYNKVGTKFGINRLRPLTFKTVLTPTSHCDPYLVGPVVAEQRL